MDILDKYWIKSILGAVEDMEGVTEEETLRMMEEERAAHETGKRWLKEEGELEDAHKEITYPIYILATSFIGNVLSPMGREAVSLYAMAAGLIRIAAQKGYEKGRGEAKDG